MQATLDDFSLAPLNHTGLFGVFLGVHALEDGLCALHAGVGCKAKTQARLVHHDLGRESHSRVGWTELSEEELIKDPGQRLVKAISELHVRRKPRVILLVASRAVEFTGIDLPALAGQARKELGIPVIALPRAADQPDLWHGYAAVIRALLGELDWSKPPGDRVSLAGAFFHRHEMEQAANLAELKRLTGALGARLGPTLLGGESFSSLQRLPQSGLLVCLPCGDLDASRIAESTGRKTIEVGLPLSLTASASFLRTLGWALDLPDQRIEEVVEAEVARAAPRIDMVRQRLPRLLAGREVAILADTPTAAGWTMLAQELGLSPSLVVLMDRHAEPERWYRELLDKMGGSVPGELKLVCRPSLPGLRRLADDRKPHLLIRPDLDLSGTGWESIPTVETGFPQNHKHFVYPIPELGFAGAVALAQRVMDAAFRSH